MKSRGLAAVVVAALVAIPVAWAGHTFTDVPDSSPFHVAIAAMRGTGITAGKTCDPPGTPPTFCPQEPITREAMAAFVHRGLGRVAHVSGSGGPLDSSRTVLGELTVRTGGAPGGRSIILLRLTGEASATSMLGCPCRVAFELRESDVAWASGRAMLSEVATSGALAGQAFGSATGQGFFQGDSAATYTFTLTAHREAGSGANLDATISASAVYIPLAATGDPSP